MIQRFALVADDDNLSREFLAEALRALGFTVDEASSGRQAIDVFDARKHRIVFSDIRMPHGDGLKVLEAVRTKTTEIPVVLVTAYGSVETAVKAMRDGASDFLLKPVSIEQIEQVLTRRRLRTSVEMDIAASPASEQLTASDDLIGESPLWRRALETSRRVARTRATVLIRGESGTGKEGIASLMHRESERRHAPFIRTNCAVLHDSLLSSELFGHEKGAFTSAYQRKEGRFELAHTGTLFLDEIGEISPEIQAKLLRVLECGEFERVGGKETLKVDVRVICATNRNLERMIDEGRFRADLYYRLNVVPITLPPLRERGDDILKMASTFLRSYAAEFGGPAEGFTPEARAALLAYPWPGNVRELKNNMQRTALLGNSHWVDAPDLGLEARKSTAGAAEQLVGRTIDEVERRLILNTLESTHGSKTRAAEILGVTARTLANKLKLWREQGTLPATISLGGETP